MTEKAKKLGDTSIYGSTVPDGLSKREYFAGLAMQEMITGRYTAEIGATEAVKYADALLEELAK